MRSVFVALSLSFLVVFGVACGGSQTEAKKETLATKPLFERLGGLPAIEAVVGDFIGNVAADIRINARFAKADIPALKQKLTDQVCQATGGPCTYTGHSMVEAHTGMNVTEEEFNAVVEDLVKSLDKFQVPAGEKNEVLTALGGMKGDIVGK